MPHPSLYSHQFFPSSIQHPLPSTWQPFPLTPKFLISYPHSPLSLHFFSLSLSLSSPIPIFSSFPTTPYIPPSLPSNDTLLYLKFLSSQPFPTLAYFPPLFSSSQSFPPSPLSCFAPPPLFSFPSSTFFSFTPFPPFIQPFLDLLPFPTPYYLSPFNSPSITPSTSPPHILASLPSCTQPPSYNLLLFPQLLPHSSLHTPFYTYLSSVHWQPFPTTLSTFPFTYFYLLPYTHSQLSPLIPSPLPSPPPFLLPGSSPPPFCHHQPFLLLLPLFLPACHIHHFLSTFPPLPPTSFLNLPSLPNHPSFFISLFIPLSHSSLSRLSLRTTLVHFPWALPLPPPPSPCLNHLPPHHLH